MPAFLLSILGGVASAIGSIASSVMSLVGNILQTAVKLVTSAVKTIANGLMAIGGLLVRGAMAFVSVLMKATQAAMAYAKSVNDFRLGTGMGMKEAADTSLGFRSFGITPEMLAQGRGNEHHSVTKMVGKAWNVDVNDPLSINRKARSFGDGMEGHAMKEAFLESVGMNTDKGRWMASLSEEQVQGQLDFTQKTASSLGISPESMSKMAEELPLAQAKLETFLELVQLKFVESALPMMEKGIAFLSDFIAEKGPQIAATFASVFEWIFVEGPDVAINAARTVIDTFQWLSDGFFSIAHTIVAFLRTLESGDSGLGLWIGNFLGIIDYISVGVNGVVKAFGVLGAVLYDLLSAISEIAAFVPNLILSMVKPFVNISANKVVAPILDKLGFGGIADFAREANAAFQNAKVMTVNDLTGMGRLINPMDAIAQTDALVPTTDYYGQFENYRNSGATGRFADEAEKNLNTAQTYVNDKIKTATNAIDTVDKATGTKDERAEMYREMIGELKGINKHTEETARGMNGGSNDTTMVGTQDWLARFAIEQARQQYLMATR